MPVTYAIDKKAGIIRTQCTGFVVLDEVLDHFRTLEADPECPKRLDVVLDLFDISSVPSSDELRAVSAEIARIQDRIQFGACAIVVGSDAFFGTAMVFEVIAAKRFRITKVFRDLVDAESWLADQRTWVR